jgi:hypothetical protein
VGLFAAFVLFGVRSGWAQTENAQIRGEVIDKWDHPRRVKATNLATGTSLKAEANETGGYTIQTLPGVIPG